MPTYTHKTGSNVKYNSKCCTVFRHRNISGEPGYLLREIFTGTVHDNILQTDITTCPLTDIVDHYWAIFTYNGNNGIAGNFIVNNIVKNIGSATNLSWGPNTDGTAYVFTASGQTWT